MKYVVALFLALALNATANLMMKFGVRRHGASGVGMDQGLTAVAQSLLSNWVLLAGLVCFAVNVAFYTYALSGIKISLAYPLMVGGGFAIIAVVAWWLLGESLSPTQWAGIAMILLGVLLVTREMQPAA
ncbi:MAG: EamA family transporter [Phycisphaerae bacterium]|nr:EamA family transporter [Phycisphaerae bacterium]